MYIILDHNNLTNVHVVKDEDGCTKGFKTQDGAYVYSCNELKHADFKIIEV